MSARPSFALVALLTLSSAVLAAPPAAQDPPKAGDAKPAPTGPSPANGLKEVDAALAARRTPKEADRDAADDRLTKAVDGLTADFAKYDDKGKKEVVDGLAKIFVVRTDENNDAIYTVAAAALSEMGADGEAVLMRAYKLKHIEKKPGARADIVESLGKHKNPKNIEFFTKLLNESDTKVVIAAVKSLGEFKDADAKTRKDVAEALVKQYANANNLDAKEKGKNAVFHQRLLDIEQPMNDALGALTLQSFTDSAAWEKWFNDNRNKKW